MRRFAGLQIAPTITVDPADGSFSFRFGVGQRPEDIDATLERLLELPAELAAAKDRRTALIMDEFQEIVDIDPAMPKLLRSIFQKQPEVAHVYLGSKRHVMERIFNDVNEPFWRSAKSIELGMIDAEPFSAFILERFDATEKGIDPAVAGRAAGADGRTSLRDAGALLLPLGADPAQARGLPGGTCRRRLPPSSAQSTGTSACSGRERPSPRS